jgi:hypothetical protein
LTYGDIDFLPGSDRFVLEYDLTATAAAASAIASVTPTTAASANNEHC